MTQVDFVAVRAIFAGKLSQNQVDGINNIVSSFDEYGDGDIRKLAYLLATTFHETARTMQPIYERGQRSYFNKYDPDTTIGKNLGNTLAGDGYKFRGRGYVQLTGRGNYARAGEELVANLVADPDIALLPSYAAHILITGCLEGWFTGKKLSTYFGAVKADPKNARRVINGVDKADTIAGYYRAFLPALSKPPLNEPSDKVEFPTLRIGARGDAVRTLQRRLVLHTVYEGRVDGIFGPGTQAAVKLFQREEGLTSDGIVGPATWAALWPEDNLGGAPVTNASTIMAIAEKQAPRIIAKAVVEKLADEPKLLTPAAPVKGPITDMFKGILAQWILRRVLEMGGVTTAIWTIISRLSVQDQQAIVDLLAGNFDKVSVGVIAGLALYLGTQVWSLVSTIRPQVVADGKQLTMTNDTAQVAKVTAQTVEANSVLENIA